MVLSVKVFSFILYERVVYWDINATFKIFKLNVAFIIYFMAYDIHKTFQSSITVFFLISGKSQVQRKLTFCNCASIVNHRVQRRCVCR